jgi:nucleotide-binding universal stress UspA family protein
MYRKILVGLDGSEHGLDAARTGIELAKLCDAELHLLTVTRPFKVTPELARFLKAENLLGEPKYVMDDMTSEIVATAKESAAEAGLTRVKTAVREGKPARALVEYARNQGIDLILVGARGVGEPDVSLLGSVSQKVSLLAKCSVMIVR